MANARLCLSAQLNSKALSQLTGFNFNSFARMSDGKVLAANEEGLYLLGGADTQAGTAIDAYFIFSVDFMVQVRISALWVHLWSAGNLNISLTFDQRTAQTTTYVLQPIQTSAWHSKKMPTSPLLDKGRLLTMKVVNVSGCDFSVSSIEADITPLGRRRIY